MFTVTHQPAQEHNQPLLLVWPAFIVTMKHTFFRHCCSICLEPLKKKSEEISRLNSGLLKSKGMEPFENDGDLFEDSNATTVRSMNVTDAESFYLTTEWTLKVDNILNSYPTIPLPSKPNHSVNNHPSPPDTNSPNSPDRHSSPHVLTPIYIQPYQHSDFTFWFFHSTISQSKIHGRTGSNECTLIALLYSKLFYSSNVDIPVITSPLTQTWVYQIIVQRILLGHRIYDSITLNSPQTFGILRAL